MEVAKLGSYTNNAGEQLCEEVGVLLPHFAKVYFYWGEDRIQAIYTDLLNHISGMQPISDSVALEKPVTWIYHLYPFLPLSTCLLQTKRRFHMVTLQPASSEMDPAFYHLVTRSTMYSDHLLSPCASGSTVFCRCLCQSNFFPNEGHSSELIFVYGFRWRSM